MLSSLWNYAQIHIFADFPLRLIGALLGTTTSATLSLIGALVKGSHYEAPWKTSLLLAVVSTCLIIAMSPYPVGVWFSLILLFLLIINWSVTFHSLAKEYGVQISNGRLGGFASKHWVKMIDYIYLIGSVIGLARLAIGNFLSLDAAARINISGIIILSIALSLRLTKTSIEIFEWSKPKEADKAEKTIIYPWTITNDKS